MDFIVFSIMGSKLVNTDIGDAKVLGSLFDRVVPFFDHNDYLGNPGVVE